MTERATECRLTLTDDDFIMRNHRVFDVALMPGVTFFDIVLRILLAQGIEVSRCMLRNVLFTEPVATAPGLDREVRILIGEPSRGVRRVTAESRPANDSTVDWRENFSGELWDEADAPEPTAIDPAALKAAAVGVRDVAELYARARAEHIAHGPPMMGFGTMYSGPGFHLAELDLDADNAAFEDQFYLHPGKLDAATLVAFGLAEPAADPYIPMFVEAFRAVRPLRGRCYVYLPGAEQISDSGELQYNDCVLYDADGRFVAEFQRMTCKRLRSPRLITRLVAELEAPPQANGLVDRVAAMVAGLLGTDSVDHHAGFYELGLDSAAMLKMSQDLEPVVGSRLYPTLLFEYPDVASLAAHLAETYPEAAVPVEPAGPGLEVCWYRSVWCAAPWTGTDRPGDVLLIGEDPQIESALRAALSAAGGRLLVAREAAQVTELLGDAGPRTFVCLAPAATEPGQRALDGYQTMWTLATTLARQRDDDRDVSFVHRGAPQHAAVAGLARAVSAEMPRLRCRSLEVEAGAPAAVLAGWILAEAGSPDQEVRYRAGVREVRRPARYEPGPARTSFKRHGVYLITGGAGGIGRAVAGELAERHQAQLLLVGRREPDADLARLIGRWEAGGARARYVRADIAAPGEAARVVAECRAEYGRVDGVLHAAGTIRDAIFFRKRPEWMAEVIAPKVRGAIELDAATAGDPLDLFVLFSSLAADLPSPGQCDYSFANAFLDRFAEWRAGRADRSGHSVSIGWPYWLDGGMHPAGDPAARTRPEQGRWPMPTPIGLSVLDQAAGNTEPHPIVCYGERAEMEETLRPVAEPPAAARQSTVDRQPSAVRWPTVDSGAVAIIGIAGRYPQAPDLDAFWANLAAGRDCITEVPADRWDHAAIYDPDRWRAGRTYGRWGGFIEGYDRFDAGFFGISRREAERMDPQERLFLMACWHAFEDAGYPPTAPGGRSTGVFVGVMSHHYQLVGEAEDGVAPLALHSSIANRVSYTLDLTGPSLAVDTACSASLTAIHLAIESLRRGECDTALAGGVNVMVHPQKYLQMAQGQWLATDGRCRSFGRDGSGYVPGEGVGVLLLKPLAAALADGDHVHAVIAGSYTNHNGRTSGFTVPGPGGQAAVIRGALERGGIDPGTVSYVEAHGTGTSLGDPIEISGLRQALGVAAREPCPIGSVKSNIGHLESAAGVAAVTKVVLQLRYRQIVPSLHSGELNPHLDLDGLPFRVPQELADWPSADGRPRRAGVSAFGAGGANAHLLLEEPPAPAPAPRPPGPYLIVLSAVDDAALRDQAELMRAYLDGGGAPAAVEVLAGLLGVPAGEIDPAETLAGLGVTGPVLAELAARLDLGPVAAGLSVDSRVGDLPGGGARTPLADIAYTTQVGRAQLGTRLAIVGSDVRAFVDGLDRYLRGEAPGPGCSWGGAGHVPAAHNASGIAMPMNYGDRGTHPSGRDTPWVELATRWVGGATIDWAAHHAPEARPQRVPLPVYPFRQERYWLGEWAAAAAPDPVARNGAADRGEALTAVTEALAAELYLSPQDVDRAASFSDMGMDFYRTAA